MISVSCRFDERNPAKNNNSQNTGCEFGSRAKNQARTDRECVVFGYFGSLLWLSGKVEIYNQQVDIDKVAISKSLTSSEGDYNTAYSNIYWKTKK